jgi:hypothetical protein
VLYATISALQHPCVFVVGPPFQIITLLIMHSHNSTPPLSNLFVSTIMKSLTSNIFINMEAKLNGCYATIVKHLLGCNNNIVNRLKQEAPSKAVSIIVINDLIVQKAYFLENLNKQTRRWKLHQKASHIWAF